VKRWHILASLLFIAGAIGLGVSPARAATPTGLCMSNYASTCARINGQMVDAWPRDISGDTNQQFTDGYIGQVASTNGRCWPFTCGDGLNATYNNDSVWDFRQINTNNCINVSGTQNQANLAACNIDNPAEWFVWTPTGALINVYQSDYWGSPQYLVGKGAGQCKADYYQPLITLNTDACVSTWVLANAT
jgi:hypothetical protein